MSQEARAPQQDVCDTTPEFWLCGYHQLGTVTLSARTMGSGFRDLRGGSPWACFISTPKQPARRAGGGSCPTFSFCNRGGGRGLPPTYFGILHKQEAYLDGGRPMKLEVFRSLVQKTKPNLEATRGTEQPSQEDRRKKSKINFRKTGRKPLVT